MQDWESFKDRRSLIFLRERILGDVLSAEGGLALWSYGVQGWEESPKTWIERSNVWQVTF